MHIRKRRPIRCAAAGFAAAAVCVLASCAAAPSEQNVDPALDVSFSADARISYGGGECAVRMKRIEPGKWEFCVTDPYPAAGLVITVSGGETKMKMYDMESIADVSEDAVSMARAVVTAYETAVSAGGKAADSGSGMYVSGSSELGGYRIDFGEGMSPGSLTSDAGRLDVKIDRFVPLEREPDEEDTDAVLII